MSLRRILTLLASLAITAGFLAHALRSVDFGKLALAFQSADYRLVLLASCFTFCGYLFRTKRWQRLLSPSKNVPVSRLFPILIIGFALNNLLPGRPGEFVRPYLLGVRAGLSKTLGFATVVFERVADGIALIGFLLIAFAAAIPLHVELPQAAQAIAILASLLFGVALAGMLFLIWRESLALALFRRLTFWLPRPIASRVEGMLGSFTSGLHSFKSRRDIVAIAVLSLGVWACESTSYFMVLAAFGQLTDLPERAVAAVFAMVVINLGIMIPAAPGGLGPFEAAAVFALGSFGLDPSSSATVALAAHAMQYLLITSLGLVFIGREGVSLAVAENQIGEN